MTEKIQQDTQSNKATPVFKGTRTGIFRSTPANEGPIEAKELPSDENVVNHELGEPSTQKTFGLPSPLCDNTPESSSADDQQRGELREMSLGESSGAQNCSVVQVGHDPVHAEKSSNYPTAPSSPTACEVLAEGLAGLDLGGKGEQDLGPGPEECVRSKDRGSEHASPTTAVPNIVPSSEPANDGNGLRQLDTEKKLEEEPSNSAKSVVVIVPARDSKQSIVSALEVTREDPRCAESEKSEAEDEQRGDRPAQTSESEVDNVDEQAALPASDAADDVTERLQKLKIQPKVIHRAPGSYFYATTTTFEGMSSDPVRATNGKKSQCFASTPSGAMCGCYPSRGKIQCLKHCLYLKGHHFRSEARLHAGQFLVNQNLVYHHKRLGNLLVAYASEFEAFTVGFHPLIKRNLYDLTKDFLLVLGTDPRKDELLRTRKSVIGGKYSLAGKNLENQDHKDLLNECHKPGQVYMVTCEPEAIYTSKMWFAGEQVRDPRRSLPVKIGHAKDVNYRIGRQSNCGIKEKPQEILPKINYVYLLEHMLHELCAAHQHDLLCDCQIVEENRETNHLEYFWFERLSGGTDLHGDLKAIVRALGNDIKRCQDFVKLLGDRLSRRIEML